METENNIQWTRINNDTNGNPRYVCHFLNLLTEQELNYTSEVFPNFTHITKTSYKYSLACKRANKIGGRKFHNKQYGGGIVFQSYNIKETEKYIRDLIEKETK